ADRMCPHVPASEIELLGRHVSGSPRRFSCVQQTLVRLTESRGFSLCIQQPVHGWHLVASPGEGFGKIRLLLDGTPDPKTQSLPRRLEASGSSRVAGPPSALNLHLSPAVHRAVPLRFPGTRAPQQDWPGPFPLSITRPRGRVQRVLRGY